MSPYRFSPPKDVDFKQRMGMWLELGQFMDGQSWGARYVRRAKNSEDFRQSESDDPYWSS
eukprot:1242534-Amphidinium_carterae.5